MGTALNDSLDDIPDDRRPSAVESIVSAIMAGGFQFVLWTFWIAAFVFSCCFWLWLGSRLASLIQS
jgi:hypothetical protein